MKNEAKNVLFDTVLVIFMILVSLIFIIPPATVFSSSFLGAEEAARRGSYVLFVENLDFTSYKAMLNPGSPIYRAYGITLLRVAVGTSLNLLFTISLAYGLSRRNVPGNGLFTTLVFLTMLFSGGLIPTYMVIKMLGINNTFWAMIFPGLIGVWNLIIMRSFLWQIPYSLEEAAIIDGAGELVVLTRIILPLSTPVIATIGLFCAVGHWNAWFDASIYIGDYRLHPLQVFLRGMINVASNYLNPEMLVDISTLPPSESVKSAAIVLSTAPILALYPFLQKYFVKGMTIGAVKG